MRIRVFLFRVSLKLHMSKSGTGNSTRKDNKKTFLETKTGTKIPLNHSSVKRLYLHACYWLNSCIISFQYFFFNSTTKDCLKVHIFYFLQKYIYTKLTI